MNGGNRVSTRIPVIAFAAGCQAAENGCSRVDGMVEEWHDTGYQGPLADQRRGP